MNASAILVKCQSNTVTALNMNIGRARNSVTIFFRFVLHILIPIPLDYSAPYQVKCIVIWQPFNWNVIWLMQIASVLTTKFIIQMLRNFQFVLTIIVWGSFWNERKFIYAAKTKTDGSALNHEDWIPKELTRQLKWYWWGWTIHWLVFFSKGDVPVKDSCVGENLNKLLGATKKVISDVIAIIAIMRWKCELLL